MQEVDLKDGQNINNLRDSRENSHRGKSRTKSRDIIMEGSWR